jgi:hypothetical protein
MKRRLSGFVLCFFLLLQGVYSSLAGADDQTPKTKSCHIHAVVRWNIGDNGKQIEGSLNLTANGTLRLSDTLQQPITKMQGNLVYEAGHIDLLYAFQETTRDKKTMFCKENPILEEWSTSGSYLFGGGVKPSRFAEGNISYDVKWSFEELKPEIRIYQYAENSLEKQKDITNNEQDFDLHDSSKILFEIII